MSKNETGWASIPAGKLATAQSKLWNELGNRGGEIIVRIDDDQDFRKHIAGFMLRGGIDGSVQHKLARARMGQNFFGVEEYATLYGVNFSKKQLREVSGFPWGKDILDAPCPFNKGKTVRETHFAYLGVDKLNGSPLTIMKFQELHPESGQPKFRNYAPDSWYHQQVFATDKTMKLRWYLLLKNIVPNSTLTSWNDQKAMLPAEYEIPTAVEETAKDLFVQRKTGIYPNLKVYARVDDTSSNGHRVNVGDCYHGSVGVYFWGDYGDDSVGLGASRLPGR
ncbi:MAG: hypothetical protein UX24_C0009G0005 [Candidatus Giovannonibacteria bacterium GW2011_GWB1_45_9b]|nr:MAG: hypothetical protein UU84_C0004G0003 [Candidatus Yanofskybacteria bacterium GW2011_GWC2_41_9]KKU04942.1 MAG: hypothetical protein UX06_C0005G0002 [Candidatus Giovannonibacteria bacterium GW2011_GWA2_45_21]KKU16473.1 MAG: hypothetical protein UX24_C0009G0005 [Candidatus Giovannonibacteria bacterium GW2011_GWB1_45_9b]